MGYSSFLKKDHLHLGFKGWFRSAEQIQSSLSHSRIENEKIHDVVLRNCELTNIAIEDCNIQGLTINGIEVETLLSTYYASSKQPLNDLTREL
ncbi:hypothetical protein [Alkalicoccobacillus porphyridii]|uniref:Pentapeptide repeat-containing protein n=1 Tax=Alkalicoccobacillus porphyridii TaxID=2597270 RepID=A0A553ZVL5_9BACI|nr:hypothetical protein [Alkalicoccobacillus porphyridii]TSB45528.1 hypothetical protein FN960_15260 [Alkalicoccobacillus porphyridii]